LRADAVASTASRPAFVTIASRPSGDETGELIELILARPKVKNFSNQGWTPDLLICPTRLGKNGGRFRELMYDSVYDESYVQDR
jgi:hypothetical protein